ncbi:NAD(P)-binding domain-containing protein [Streptomyces clavuligerus]|uniref:Dimethylaniline monooxygenase N-oxide forming n=1 Tax=Streptomyces clavuligerus TaxID=1901 RepID=E2Q427_STRCL|nr:NAD(P)-binding domain-containing protein [Streptomyces clavuligerus]ANW18410.1 dimethylaniline monooxygenase [Streptomyces clavuligerus]AXU12965.1 dimethylaniline monooxygenase [Streptomyces clavuligerus]EFG08965.1 dimethylaniline monooxygenase N-oxide forming [Streptomyces clavuligerus]MBY6302893.1 NAD(P)-binding domain-containing protein [Streptomyces clavuligerus]QCS05749.1 dimethylaniline monooxygenase [Streptomyces clavuligerus]
MYDLAVIGAGPYGLSIAAHAAAAGLSVKVFGRAMASWRDHMPEGMFLKSEPWSSNLSDPYGVHTLRHFSEEHGFEAVHGRPLSIAAFTEYGLWFAEHAVPGVDERTVIRLAPAGNGYSVETADGECVLARTAVLAVGVMPFVNIPRQLDGFSADQVSHSSGHRDLSCFRGQDVTVLGAGQAALETATLLAEQGARPRLIARRARLNWNTPPEPLQRGPLRTLSTPHSGLGTGWTSWVWSEAPWAVRRLPGAARQHIARTALGPAGAWWLRERYERRVPALLGHGLRAAEARGGRVLLRLDTPGGAAIAVETDHVIAATGFTPDLARLDLLDASLRRAVATTAGGGRAPELSAGFESSYPGLFFAGLLTAPSFGPSMRFVHGATFTAHRLVEGVRRRLRTRTAVRLPRPAASPAFVTPGAPGTPGSVRKR